MRTHVVMVPGFGGFDGLGQLHYYVGITSRFDDWSKGVVDGAIHYFDNLPTAAVKTRGARLARFVKQLVARHVIRAEDKIVLVGHSTGGLDIRQMLRDLDAAATGNGRVSTRASRRDTKDSDSARALAMLRDQIDRVVFLSVPHYGTNIADWVDANLKHAQKLVDGFRRAMNFPIGLPLGPFRWLLGNAEIFDAVEDARRDLQPADPDDPLTCADAREARAEIDLWLAHTAADFFAIADLQSATGHGHRIVETPEEDRRIWAKYNIASHSYATLGRALGSVTSPQPMRSPFDVVLAAGKRNIRDTDFLYRIAYTACVGGPFRADPVEWNVLGEPGQQRVECWNNDGIVNTASMIAPDGTPPIIVRGDHADVIGHYRRKEVADAKRGRRADAYDLLGSDDTFTDKTFENLWNDVFAFAFKP